VDVPVCAKLLQPAPWQRSTKYWLMVPPVSVDAVALAARLPGAVGEFTGVVALAVFEYALKLFEASVARTL
jgi:hypothetical protein